MSNICIRALERTWNEHKEPETGDTSWYEPLDGTRREFRLMRVRYSRQEIIHCELRSFALDEAPSYTALSYMWTDSKPTCEIALNGIPFYVRPNLYAYLETFQNEEKYGWYFIDAICINQEDITEKEIQVGLMGEVFRYASKVVAWVNHLTFELNDNDHDLVEEYCSGKSSFESLQGVEDRQKFLNTIGLLNLVFLDSTYCSRLWIVQEVVLARDLILRSGAYQIPAKLILPVLGCLHDAVLTSMDARRIGEVIMYRNDPEQVTSPQDRQALYIWVINNIFSLQYSTQERPQINLVDAITLLALQSCRNIHDRIFGLLGIVEAHIEVDYSLDVLELYLRILNEGLYLGPTTDENDQAETLRARGDGVGQTYQARVLTSRDAAKVYQFIFVLRKALGLSSSDAVVMLATEETLNFWGMQSSYLSLEAIIAQPQNRWKKRFNSQCTRLRLRRIKKRNKLLVTPGDTGLVRTYSRWVEFVHHVYLDVQARMYSDSQIFHEFEELVRGPLAAMTRTGRMKRLASLFGVLLQIRLRSKILER